MTLIKLISSENKPQMVSALDCLLQIWLFSFVITLYDFMFLWT